MNQMAPLPLYAFKYLRVSAEDQISRQSMKLKPVSELLADQDWGLTNLTGPLC